MPSPFLVAILDAIWTAIVSNRKNTARWLVVDGMAALLDILEGCHISAQPLLLSLLAGDPAVCMPKNGKSPVYNFCWCYVQQEYVLVKQSDFMNMNIYLERPI